MHRNLSFHDINSVPEAAEILASGDEEKIKKMLFDVGFDITRPIEQQYCLHRTLRYNEVVEGWRYVGEERKDQEWVDSKYCTRENKLEILGAKDFLLLRDIISLGRRPNFTAMIISHMQGDSEDVSIKYVQEEVEDGE